MARRLYEDEAIPQPLRARFHASLADGGDEMLRYSLEMFRFLATGGADHLSGQHIAFHATGRHRIDDLRKPAPA